MITVCSDTDAIRRQREPDGKIRSGACVQNFTTDEMLHYACPDKTCKQVIRVHHTDERAILAEHRFPTFY
ncbi:hypothetical protein RR46_03895 [Papilio xuthus]|uniref:Uncharacterized protein n=1 Tax=Papilio xuthus TaxID=66420 RepID=A0A194Q7Z4_PAPXU|nr:hypothetical protein RR46_03895 [Papilio xuthus]